MQCLFDISQRSEVYEHIMCLSEGTAVPKPKISETCLVEYDRCIERIRGFIMLTRRYVAFSKISQLAHEDIKKTGNQYWHIMLCGIELLHFFGETLRHESLSP